MLQARRLLQQQFPTEPSIPQQELLLQQLIMSPRRDVVGSIGGDLGVNYSTEIGPSNPERNFKLMKDGCSNSVNIKALKNQKSHFSIVLLSKLLKEIEFGLQLKAPGKKCEPKEGKEKKGVEKHYRCRKFCALKTYGKETMDIAIDNKEADKEDKEN
ncbi:hypothetical protein TNCV_4632111 [Trichonephila clavipes]|nr:hypothetical protein TNCV_4632111 [Trichonephila clavipes]